MGHSRGRMSTKTHSTVDTLGNPLRWKLTGRQVADMTQAAALIAGLATTVAMGDKGSDADAFAALIIDADALAVIPPFAKRFMSDQVETSTAKLNYPLFTATDQGARNLNSNVSRNF